MAAPRIAQGELQCGKISSTSDIFNVPFKSKFQIKGRPSYRKSLSSLAQVQPNWNCRFSGNLPT